MVPQWTIQLKHCLTQRYFTERRVDPRPYGKEEAIYLSLAVWSNGNPQIILTSCGEPIRFAESIVTKCGVRGDDGTIYRKETEGYGYRRLLPRELEYCPHYLQSDVKDAKVEIPIAQSYAENPNGTFAPQPKKQETETSKLLGEDEQEDKCCIIL